MTLQDVVISAAKKRLVFGQQTSQNAHSDICLHDVDLNVRVVSSTTILPLWIWQLRGGRIQAVRILPAMRRLFSTWHHHHVQAHNHIYRVTCSGAIQEDVNGGHTERPFNLARSLVPCKSD